MLETIKEEISKLPDINFNDYYQQYILDVQDENIYKDNLENLSIDALIGRLRKELEKFS